jgi:hypothetical protein
MNLKKAKKNKKKPDVAIGLQVFFGKMSGGESVVGRIAFGFLLTSNFLYNPLLSSTIVPSKR